MLRVVTWLWKPRKRYRSQYQPWHVERMRDMVAKHCSIPYEFICVTDQPAQAFGEGIRVVPLWNDHSNESPAFADGPSCYRRLRIFSVEAYQLLGVPQHSTVISVDIDAVVCGDLAPLWDRDDHFVGWNASERAPTCGSMFLHKLGTLRKVWDQFEVNVARERALRNGFVGTDQAWMAHMLAGGAFSWTTKDGVYSFKMHCMNGLPKDARIVFFHGKPDPWEWAARDFHPWVAKHYPMPPGLVPDKHEMVMIEV